MILYYSDDIIMMIIPIDIPSSVLFNQRKYYSLTDKTKSLNIIID